MSDEDFIPQPIELDRPDIFLNCLTALKDTSEFREEGVRAAIEYMNFNLRFADVLRDNPSDDHVFKVAVATIALLHTLPGSKVSDEMLNMASNSDNMANSGFATSILLARRNGNSIGTSITHSQEDYTLVSLERESGVHGIEISLGFDGMANVTRGWIKTYELDSIGSQFRKVRQEIIFNVNGVVEQASKSELKKGELLDIKKAIGLITDGSTLASQDTSLTPENFKM